MSWQIALLTFSILCLCIIAVFAFGRARRLDALHTSVMKARKVLENALIARGQLAHEFANLQVLDIASAVLLEAAAEEVLRLAVYPLVDDGVDSLRGALPLNDVPKRIPANEGERLSVESELSRTLRLTVDELDETELSEEELACYQQLQGVRQDVRLTRRFHNIHVSQVCRVRRRTLTKILRLAGNVPMPLTVDIDDE